MDLKALRENLRAVGQVGVLRFYDSLEPAGKARLEQQLAALDLQQISKLVDEYVKRKPHVSIPENIHPVQAFPRTPGPGQEAIYKQALEQGEKLLHEGKVAAFLVAGGQGTRLGYDGPKGEYPVTPIKTKPLFQVFAEQLLAQERIFERRVPWYIMTSDVNDAPTRAFFQTHNYFGYMPDDVIFFQQGMMPAFDQGGQMLLGERDSLALSPDGHGGSLRALQKSGALADMRQRGIEHLSYFQVDNPMVHCIDPLFLGLHALTGSEMSSKTIPKAGPLEKVGNFVFADGTVQVIEYSDLPEELAKQTNSDGSLRFNAGSIAIHALALSFIERLNGGGDLKLPWHRAEKKVPYVERSGDTHQAGQTQCGEARAVRLRRDSAGQERDRLHRRAGGRILPGEKRGRSRQPRHCRRDQIRRAARWLTAAGVKVPQKGDMPAATIEISALFAENETEIRALSPSLTIQPGSEIYLGEQGIEVPA